MDEIGVGVLGTGWVAGEHIRSYGKIPGCRVVGLCSRTEEGARAKAIESGVAGARIYTGFDEMLADPAVHAVSICTPPNQHPGQVIAAARAGKHLLIEKAVANDPRLLGAMLRAVHEAGVKTVVSFVLHWNPEFVWIRRMLDEGTIGKIFIAEVDYWHNIGPHYAQYRWNVKREIAGSALLSAGCHAVDALRWFVQDEVDEVSAYSNRQNLEYEYDTNLVGILKFRGGAVGKTSTSLDVKSPYAFNIDLLGERGSIRDNRIFAREFFGGQTDWIEVPTIRPDSGDVTHHPFDGELSHFIDTVRSGEESPLNLSDAAKTHAVCFALDRSAAERRPVRMEEIEAEMR
ncbi:MAG TPA: Gfo/Idh/MocA family oxidoreductase [Chthonomonadaceae bacterium]|nr:Gfo/Idh/MocA family oxidoreductase [Chthonomonadaceae bacterium]